MTNSPAHQAMAQSTNTIRRQKRISNLLFHIFIRVNVSQLGPRKRTAKRRSQVPKITYSKGRKKRGEMVKHPKTARRSSCLRGARKRQRRLRRKRKNFAVTKQALPAFFLFMAQVRSELQRQNPHLNMVQIVKKLGRMWHKQPEEDKEMYKQEAERLRRRKQGRKSQKRPGKKHRAKKRRAGRRK